MEEDDAFVPLSQVAARIGGGSASDRAAWDAREDDDPHGNGQEAGEPAGAEATARRHAKTYHDPIHGPMRLDPFFQCFVDTDVFQRLRYLAQLGLTSYVFPSATHTRFEHSLGVCHKAFALADHLWAMNRGRRGDGNVDINQRDLLVVGLAGLCHDLGHGPFSHVWDKEFCQEALGLHNWKHEEMSCKLLEHMVDQAHIDGISQEEVRLAQNLILGNARSAPDGKMFLFDIVSNSRNSIDVDKLDYLERDALHCGVKVGCEFRRIAHYAKVINNEICYRWSEYHNILELFHARETMHRRVYTHRKAKAIEYMVVDALKEADQVLRFSEDMDDPANFLRLDDTLLRQIEFHPDSQGPMGNAKRILQRVRHRELYRHVNEFLVPREFDKDFVPPTAQDICSLWTSNGQVQLDPSQVVVNLNRLNWAMKDKNPVDNVHWFWQFEDTTSLTMEQHHMTHMSTTNYQETMLRLYSKDRRKEVTDALDVAFTKYCAQRFSKNGGPVCMATPRRAAAAGGVGGAALPGHETLLRREQAQLESSVYKRPRPGGAGGRAGAAGAGRGGGGAGPSSQPGPGPSTQQGSEDGSGAEGQQLPVAGHPGDAQVKVPAKRRRSLHEDMEAAVGDLGTG